MESQATAENDPDLRAEAEHVDAILVVARELAAQRESWRAHERNLLDRADNAIGTEFGLELTRAAASSADVARKALAAELEIHKLMARVRRVSAMRRERIAMRMGRSH